MAKINTPVLENEEDVAAGDRSLEETLPPDQNNQFDLEVTISWFLVQGE